MASTISGKALWVNGLSVNPRIVAAAPVDRRRSRHDDEELVSVGALPGQDVAGSHVHLGQQAAHGEQLLGSEAREQRHLRELVVDGVTVVHGLPFV